MRGALKKPRDVKKKYTTHLKRTLYSVRLLEGVKDVRLIESQEGDRA